MNYKQWKRLVVVSLLLIFSACSRGEPTLPEKESPEAQVFLSRCGGCHPVPHPEMHTFQRWNDLIGLMEMQIERKRIEPLKPEEKEMILTYLKRNTGANKQ